MAFFVIPGLEGCSSTDDPFAIQQGFRPVEFRSLGRHSGSSETSRSSGNLKTGTSIQNLKNVQSLKKSIVIVRGDDGRPFPVYAEDALITAPQQTHVVAKAKALVGAIYGSRTQESLARGFYQYVKQEWIVFQKQVHEKLRMGVSNGAGPAGNGAGKGAVGAGRGVSKGASKGARNGLTNAGVANVGKNVGKQNVVKGESLVGSAGTPKEVVKSANQIDWTPQMAQDFVGCKLQV
jgi:hypothetical protein